ncbi:MAG: hypothetical protein IRZ16_20705 [Myxococcaceae bacterium]|nr:hypothetical protein [Myxococcaceae bacterium]
MGDHTLLAQADLPAPPLPSTEVTSSAHTPQQLQLRIDELNREIRSIDVNWPTHLLIIGYAGYVLAPTCLLFGGGIALMGLLGLSNGVGSAALVAVGAAVFLVGVAGVAAIVYAWTTGNAIQQEARRRRDALIREREAAEAELRALRSSRTDFAPPGALVTLLTF